MTLILAINCIDGMVLASDSQGTLGPLRQDWEKIFTDHTNLAWGGAGNLGMVQRIRAHIMSTYPDLAQFEQMQPTDVKNNLSAAVAAIVRPMLQSRVLSAGNDDLSEYLFIGHSTAGSFIININQNLNDVDYISTGYAAIGSGSGVSLVVLSNLTHFEPTNRSLREVKLIACRVMEDAIRVASVGVALPLQMIEIVKPTAGAAGQARKLPKDEIDALSAVVADWKELERTNLSDTLGIQVPAS